MRQKIQNWIEQYRHMDWAVLYMRMFAGGLMIFHNIGKIQNYNEIITSYPSLLHLSPATVFVLVSTVEVVLSVLIIMGLWVRISSLIMALGVLLAMAWGNFSGIETEFIWLGLYVFLVVSGGGLYAFDAVLTPVKHKK